MIQDARNLDNVHMRKSNSTVQFQLELPRRQTQNWGFNGFMYAVHWFSKNMRNPHTKVNKGSNKNRTWLNSIPIHFLQRMCATTAEWMDMSPLRYTCCLKRGEIHDEPTAARSFNRYTNISVNCEHLAKQEHFHQEERQNKQWNHQPKLSVNCDLSSQTWEAKTGGMAAWRGCEAHGRLLLLLLLNQLFIFLQEFPSRPQDVVTMATMVTTSIQPGMDVGILMCTILHQGNEPRKGKANMSWTHLGGFQNPRWKFVRLRPPDIGKEPRPPFVGLSGVASWHSTNHTVHIRTCCIVMYGPSCLQISGPKLRNLRPWLWQQPVLHLTDGHGHLLWGLTSSLQSHHLFPEVGMC